MLMQQKWKEPIVSGVDNHEEAKSDILYKEKLIKKLSWELSLKLADTFYTNIYFASKQLNTLKVEIIVYIFCYKI